MGLKMRCFMPHKQVVHLLGALHHNSTRLQSVLKVVETVQNMVVVVVEIVEVVDHTNRHEQQIEADGYDNILVVGQNKVFLDTLFQQDDHYQIVVDQATVIFDGQQVLFWSAEVKLVMVQLTSCPALRNKKNNTK